MLLVGMTPELVSDEPNKLNRVFECLVGRQVGHHLVHGGISVANRLGCSVKSVFGAHYKGPKSRSESLVDKGVEHGEFQSRLPAHDEKNRMTGALEMLGAFVIALTVSLAYILK